MSAQGASKEFDWLETESVVVPQVDAVAVYLNPAGNVVIRQRDPMGEDDAVIVIDRTHAAEVAKALRNVVKK